jgi:prophage regulatory protein
MGFLQHDVASSGRDDQSRKTKLLTWADKVPQCPQLCRDDRQQCSAKAHAEKIQHLTHCVSNSRIESSDVKPTDRNVPRPQGKAPTFNTTSDMSQVNSSSPLQVFDAATAPSSSLLRLKQIVGSPKDGIPPLIPVCKATWWRGVKDGRYPQPIKLSPGVTVWRSEDIRKLIINAG